jgi:hypothetical protein
MRSAKRFVKLLHMTFEVGTRASDPGWAMLFVSHRVVAGAFVVRTGWGFFLAWRSSVSLGRPLIVAQSGPGTRDLQIGTLKGAPTSVHD